MAEPLPDWVPAAVVRCGQVSAVEAPLTPEFDRLLDWLQPRPDREGVLTAILPEGGPVRDLLARRIGSPVGRGAHGEEPPTYSGRTPGGSLGLAAELEGTLAGIAAEGRVHTTVRPTKEFITEGGFRLTRYLGSGATGHVYEAESVAIRDGPRVAIKLLHPTPLSSGSRGALTAMAEAQAGFGLRHPNLMRVYACGQSLQHGTYVAMEFVDGEPLDQWLAGKKREHGGGWRLGDRAAAEVVAVVADAVAEAYAGEKRLVHRDIKPANILGAVSHPSDPTRLDVRRLKLGDFGLAQHASGTTVTGGDAPVYGTLGYMAPEQLTTDPGSRVSGAADVFALGVTLVELATNELPLSEAEAKALVQIQEALGQPALDRERVEALRHDYRALLDPVRMTARMSDPYLRGIARKCLAVGPASRYAEAGQLRDDLRAWLDDRRAVMSDGPYSRLDRLKLFYRRCCRPEKRFDRDKEVLWSLGFIATVPCVLFWAILCSLLIVCAGADLETTQWWTGLAAAVSFLAVGVGLLGITRDFRVVGWMLGSIGALLVGIQMIARLGPTDRIGEKFFGIMVLLGMFNLLIGLGDRRWRLALVLGAVTLVVAATTSGWFYRPEAAAWGPLVVGSFQCLFLLVMAIGHLWPVRKSVWEVLRPAGRVSVASAPAVAARRAGSALES